MLKINLICIGNLKEKYLKEACAEYEKRLKSYAKLSIIEIDECKLSKNPSKTEIEAAIITEGRKIINKFGSRSVSVAMCIEGIEYSSEKFAEKINNMMTTGISEINFIIGGSYGLSDEVKSKSDFKISLSRMTFTHMMARVLLLEQIYRAFQINSDGKYHK